MNRLQPWVDSDQPTSTRAHLFSARIFHKVDEGVPHHLFSPMHYEPNYAYPLMVWLHGPGGNEGQIDRIMPLISMRNYAAVAPRGTMEVEAGGYDWCHSSKGIAAATQRVFDAIEQATERFHVAPQRVFLAGFQGGGTMALRIALSHPEKFAGGLSCGGAFPEGHAPLARLNELRQLPIFLAHGRESEVYTVDHTCDHLRLFHAAGMSVSLRQYPGGDYLDTQILHDLNVWMMDIVTGNAS